MTESPGPCPEYTAKPNFCLEGSDAAPDPSDRYEHNFVQIEGSYDGVTDKLWYRCTKCLMREER